MNITKGSINLYFCFDVAYEIAVEKIEKIFGRLPVKSRLEYFKKLTPKHIQYKTPPLYVKLKPVKIDNTLFEAAAKIYDFGVITIKFTTPFSGSFRKLEKTSYDFVEYDVLRKKAEDLLKKTVKEIEPALINQEAEYDWEDYAIFIANKFDKKIDSKTLLTKHKRDIASVLRSENNLSEMEVNDSVKNPLSYTRKDLAIVDWNAAFIYDPQVSYDVMDVIEYAVIELLELRTYDDLLDTSLDNDYEEISKIKGIAIDPFGTKLNSLSKTQLEISSVIDKVENALKLVGDLFLAKVYHAASSRFYLDKWKESVKSKLNTIKDIYTVLYERTSNRRMLILEALIVLLFIVDIYFYIKGV